MFVETHCLTLLPRFAYDRTWAGSQRMIVTPSTTRPASSSSPICALTRTRRSIGAPGNMQCLRKNMKKRKNRNMKQRQEKLWDGLGMALGVLECLKVLICFDIIGLWALQKCGVSSGIFCTRPSIYLCPILPLEH